MRSSHRATFTHFVAKMLLSIEWLLSIYTI